MTRLDASPNAIVRDLHGHRDADCILWRLMIALWRNFFSLARSDRGLVLEAAALMAFARTALRVVRYRTLQRTIDRYIKYRTPSCVRPATAVSIGSVRWAIRAVASRFPSSTCLVQALAADAMLRRRRMPSEIRIGVRTRPDDGTRIEAHAWVECDGAVAVGDLDDLVEFKTLAPARSR